MLGITTSLDASACRLFADLCKQVIKRGEHRLVVESDGALLSSRCGVRFAFGVFGRIDGGGRHPAGHLPDGEGSLVEAVTANALGMSPRVRPWCA
jgi:hypothetical protein